ncbi:hypothetical protein AB0D49_28990 [Streptomyces sp. NPDC048290]|uniref:hypothetical protein n=1 Tax=Streptomyces sp. NPDC048290 TaxID=3155811 RepID=UPI0034388A7B
MRITFASTADLADAIRRAAQQHGDALGVPYSPDTDWIERFALHMAREQHPEDTGPDRFRQLPARIALDDTIASHPSTPKQDPDAGRDHERDFLLHYSADD